MIGLLIQDNQYEQDIRELLMSFYPGEAYVHEVKDGADFYVETRLGDGAVSIYIWENAAATEDCGGDKTGPEGCGGGAAGPEPGKGQAPSCPEGLKGWMLGDSCTRPSDLFGSLRHQECHKENVLPHAGSAHGKGNALGFPDRHPPHQDRLTRLEEGWKEEDIPVLL